jgi:hypothetical protein
MLLGLVWSVVALLNNGILLLSVRRFFLCVPGVFGWSDLPCAAPINFIFVSHSVMLNIAARMTD